jgi:hypothetical protein
MKDPKKISVVAALIGLGVFGASASADSYSFTSVQFKQVSCHGDAESDCEAQGAQDSTGFRLFSEDGLAHVLDTPDCRYSIRDSVSGDLSYHRMMVKGIVDRLTVEYGAGPSYIGYLVQPSRRNIVASRSLNIDCATSDNVVRTIALFSAGRLKSGQAIGGAHIIAYIVQTPVQKPAQHAFDTATMQLSRDFFTPLQEKVATSLLLKAIEKMLFDK